MGVLRGIGKGLAGTAAVAGAGAAWAGRGLGLGNTMAAAMATGAVFKMGMDRVGSDSDSGTDSGTATDKDKAEAQESWAGSNKILLAIYKDIVAIRQHLKGSIIPESVATELALERESRFAKIMEALNREGLFVSPASDDDDSNPWEALGRFFSFNKFTKFIRRVIPFLFGILGTAFRRVLRMSWTAIKFLLRRIPWILAGLVLWQIFTNWDSIVASIKETMADIKAKIDAAVAWVNDMIQPIKDTWEDAQDLYLKAIDFTTETLEKMFGDGADALDEDALDDKEIALAERILDKEEQILEEGIKLDNLEEGSIDHQRGTAVVDRLEGESAVLKTALAEEKITNAERVIEKHEAALEAVKKHAVDPEAARFLSAALDSPAEPWDRYVWLPDGTFIKNEVATDVLAPEELQRQKDIIAENKDIILQEAPNIPSVAAATSPEKEHVQPGGVDEWGQFILDGEKQNEEFVPPGSVGVDGKFTPDYVPSSSSKFDDPGAGVEKDKIKPSKEKEQQQTEGTPPKVKSGTGADGPAGRYAKPKEDAIKKDEKAIDKKSEDVGPHHPQPGLPDPKPGDDWFFDEKGKLNIIIRGNKNTSTSITPGNLNSTITGTYMPLLDKSLSVVTQNINRAMNNASIKKTSKNYNIDYGAVNPYQPLYKKVVNV